MKINAYTRIYGSKVLLVPYKKQHVPKYHKWMQDSELLQLTASEPLTLEQEYDMQKSWRNDEDKLTFIVVNVDSYQKTSDEIESMAGDVNLFLDKSSDVLTAEVEVMIAEPSCRGRGLGREAVCLMMKYGMDNLSIRMFTVKVSLSNTVSLQLFTKLGFQEVSRCDYFQEITLHCPVTDQAKQWIDSQAEHMEIIETQPHKKL